jgi:hypothetical protein
MQQIKIARSGLRGSDLDAFVKRASVQFIDKMASIRFGPGEIPVHLIAVGATEYYGPNRNGDGFKEATCRIWHPTFEKYARWYRNHDNKDTAKGRGVIRATCYNEPMHRIELIVGLNGDKEAADRNHGLIADEEMEKLARGEDIPVSMACRVKYDVCSGCGNKAKTRADYCGPDGHCKYGGCRDNLAKTFEDGHTLHVDNPDPIFFDISNVFRPADRIAYTLGRAGHRKRAFEEMAKAASDNLYGVEKRASAVMAAECGITAPLWIMDDGPWADPRIVGQLKIAQELINLEDIGAHIRDQAVPARCAVNDLPDLRSGQYKLAHVVTALAEHKCMLPVDQFVALLAGGHSEKTANAADRVAERLPGVYNRLASDPRLEDELRNNPYLPTGAAPRKMAFWALKHAAEWSLDRPRCLERMQLATLRQTENKSQRMDLVKVAQVDGSEELAKQYALYQLGFLYSHSADPEAGLLREMAVRSNFVR